MSDFETNLIKDLNHAKSEIYQLRQKLDHATDEALRLRHKLEHIYALSHLALYASSGDGAGEASKTDAPQ